MAQKITFYCDGCGVEKKDVNHWWSIAILSGDNTQFVVRPWWENFAAAVSQFPEQYKCYCGQQCVIKALSEYMEGCREGSAIREKASQP